MTQELFFCLSAAVSNSEVLPEAGLIGLLLFQQMLTITLDESDCFAAWVSAKDAGFSSSDGSDPKCKTSERSHFIFKYLLI